MNVPGYIILGRLNTSVNAGIVASLTPCKMSVSTAALIPDGSPNHSNQARDAPHCYLGHITHYSTLLCWFSHWVGTSQGVCISLFLYDRLSNSVVRGVCRRWHYPEICYQKIARVLMLDLTGFPGELIIRYTNENMCSWNQDTIQDVKSICISQFSLNAFRLTIANISSSGAFWRFFSFHPKTKRTVQKSSGCSYLN